MNSVHKKTLCSVGL